MNVTDILIIYLALGAPLGVYYFLQNRRQNNSVVFWLKTFIYFLFWLPLSLLFLRKNKVLQTSQIIKLSKEKKILLAQKQIESVLQASDLTVSIYEFREIFDRYLGLTLAVQEKMPSPPTAEKEIFRLSAHERVDLGAICLQRRNRRQVFYHHTLARKDFLQLIEKSIEFALDGNFLGKLTVEFAKLLNDAEAQIALEQLFADISQTGRGFAVKKPEKDLWNPNTQLPLSANTIPTRLSHLTATANLPIKD